MIKEFREFIMRGDVLDLAVGVVIGSAFTSIVNQVVQGLITPLIGWIVAMITGTSDLEGALSILDWSPTKGVTFAFGNVISAIITFLITGLILSCQSGKPCEEFTRQRSRRRSGRSTYCRRLS